MHPASSPAPCPSPKVVRQWRSSALQQARELASRRRPTHIQTTSRQINPLHPCRPSRPVRFHAAAASRSAGRPLLAYRLPRIAPLQLCQASQWLLHLGAKTQKFQASRHPRRPLPGNSKSSEAWRHGKARIAMQIQRNHVTRQLWPGRQRLQTESWAGSGSD